MLNKILKPIVHLIPENNRIERIWKLAHVDFQKRYYNDKLGLVWALLNPLLRILVYYLVFTYVFEVKEENYAMFLFAGLLIWMTFTEASTKGLSIIQSKRYLIQNIQFEHIDLFISMTISVFIGFTFNFLAYIFFLILTGIPLTLNLLLLPILFLNVFIICMGTSMILSVIQIYLKDIVHAWTIITLAGFWSSGIFLRGEKFLEVFPPLLYINPFVGIIMNMRAISLNGGPPDWYIVLVNYATSIVVLTLGIVLYKKFSHKAIENL